MIPLTPEEIQRHYYSDTASAYDSMHIDEADEHGFALAFLSGVINHLGIRSILDVGSGTGRAVLYLKKHAPEIRVIGVEPIRELREIGYSKGLSENDLIDGDATRLAFDASSFDLVCEFGVLHHIRNPELAVGEMLRVSAKAIFISDCNNFGQGSPVSRTIKQTINFFRLWTVVDLIKTRGKGYHISEGDGLAYSYSVFNAYRQIRSCCHSIHLLNLTDAGLNLYRSASHVALLGVK